MHMQGCVCRCEREREYLETRLQRDTGATKISRSFSVGRHADFILKTVGQTQEDFKRRRVVIRFTFQEDPLNVQREGNGRGK